MCVLVMLIFLNNYWAESKSYGSLVGGDEIISPMLLMYILLGEHVMSYSFGIFREFDVKKNGVANNWGIESAKRESCLRVLEIIVDLILFVFILLNNSK